MSTASEEVLPQFCIRGGPHERSAEADRHELFSQLRNLWVKAESGRDYTALSKRLGYRPQRVAQWATGSGNSSPPPWSVIQVICYDLGLAVLLTPTQCLIIQDPALNPASE